MEKTYEDTCVLIITDTQWKWLETTEMGLDRFRDTIDNEREILPFTTFGRFVEYLLEQTDLLVEHDTMDNVPHWKW